MQDGFLTIVTTVDGTESRISRKAEMEIAPLSAVLRYQDEAATVSIFVAGDEVRYERYGDYSLALSLKEGAQTQGTISVAGADGELRVITHRLGYNIGKGSLLLKLHYTLDFGEEKQDMRLRINAKIYSEEK